MRNPFRTRLGEGPIPLPPPRPADQIGPLIEAVSDPLIVLDGYHISHANTAARTLLGQHIVGDYVRLALRHPAATAVIAGDENGPVTLSGLGGHDRVWELTGGDIRPGCRLLRLTDRSGARAAEQMRVDFVANASHELRTPLAALIGFIETLEDANGPEDAAARMRFLGIMAGEAQRMQRLIDDLLSLSRIEADRYARPRETVDLVSIVAIACGELNDERVVLNLPGVPIPMEGDRAQLSQLVQNIVVNAMKYGRPDTQVHVTLTVEGETARLSVADEGEGIPAEFLPRVTERFFRVDAGRSRAIGGTGLGLAIVKHIAERHRAELDIASTPGVGTTVTVTFPVPRTELS